MKKIIALAGAASTGKSSTIKTFSHLLRKRFGAENVENLPCHNEKADVQIIVRSGNLILGVEGQGDPNSRLFLDLCQDTNSLDVFREAGCNLIVCATRTRGATRDAVTAMSKHGYEVERMESQYKPVEAEFKSSNLRLANQLLDKVEMFVTQSQ